MWHLTRDRVLMVTAAVLAVVAGTMTVLYLTKDSTPTPAVAGAPKSPQNTRTSQKSPPESPNLHGAKAEYAVRNKWKDGFNAEVTVTNLGSQPMEGWTVRLEMPDSVDITSTWGANAVHQAGKGTLVLRSQAWNTYLQPGGSIRMGFEAKGAAAEPTSCSVNGSPC